MSTERERGPFMGFHSQTEGFPAGNPTSFASMETKSFQLLNSSPPKTALRSGVLRERPTIHCTLSWRTTLRTYGELAPGVESSRDSVSLPVHSVGRQAGKQAVLPCVILCFKIVAKCIFIHAWISRRTAEPINPLDYTFDDSHCCGSSAVGDTTVSISRNVLRV